MNYLTRCLPSVQLKCKQSLLSKFHLKERKYSTQSENELIEQVFKSQRKRGRFIFVLLPLTAFGLGAWQTYRLKWKEGIIEERKKKVNDAPIILSADSFKDHSIQDLENRNFVGEGEFVEITVDGEHGKEIAVGPRTLDGKPGFYLISPFRLNDGTIVLVNRGWIPREMNTFTSLQSLKVKGKVKIKGYIRPSASKSSFTPENNPKKNNWYWIDVSSIASLFGAQPVLMELSNQVVDEKGKKKGEKYPISGLFDPINIPNNHFNYSLTWYSLGVILSGLTWKFIRK